MTNNQAIYSYLIKIPAEAIDPNGHVNNVVYVQWMQEAALKHYRSLGGYQPMQAVNATWVVREHHVEYLLPAYKDEEIEIRTWVSDIRRVRSTRHYQFIRKLDGALLVRGQTIWVFVDTNTGRPLAIPPEMQKLFNLLPSNHSHDQ